MLVNRLITLVTLFVLAGPVAHADQTDEALPELFTDLKDADTAQQALAIEAQIWKKWYEREDDQGGDNMTAAVEAMTTGRYTIALNLLNGLVEEHPDFAEAWNRRATLFYLLGEFEKSLADIQHTLTLEPRHFGAISGIGLIMLQLGEDERALHAFEQVLNISPKNPGAAKNIKELEEKLGTTV
jgi:tetratricopeptide (TPR) repeat protein